MPKYLFKASFTPEGVAGVRSEGGTSRREVVSDAVSALGGSLETFHFAFGAVDVYAIADLPDNEAAAGLALEISSSGRVGSRRWSC